MFLRNTAGSNAGGMNLRVGAAIQSMPKALETPVLFLVFNRPKTTARVFEEIRKAKPLRLYVAADGPRSGRQGEARLCAQVRKIATSVDWKCKVKTLFRKKNLGCKRAVSSAINRFFKNEKEGIILEDDCLPNPDFFRFCEAMLKKYRHNKRIMHIGGNNFQNGIKRGNASYYFSSYSHVWGWATWRRAWNHYNPCPAKLPQNLSWYEWPYWRYVLWKLPKIDTWDLQWHLSVLSEGGLAVTPNVNLVSNIGFSKDALHTKDARRGSANIPTRSMGKITHPKKIERDAKADYHTFMMHYFAPVRRLGL